MKKSDDPLMRELAVAPYKKELERQNLKRKRVREGTATEAEKNFIDRKNRQSRQYYRLRGKERRKERKKMRRNRIISSGNQQVSKE